MRLLSVFALLALLGCGSSHGEPPRSATNEGATGGPPNIVLAIADDLDPDHLGFCGNPLAHSPNLDELARQGVYFPTIYVQAVCRPALATLITGRWPQETGITDNQVKAPLEPAGALPAALKQRGYATFCAGKFWEGNLSAFGFDAPAENDETFAREGGENSQDTLFHFLDEHAKKGPWFVWWAPSLPHTPHRPPARFAKLFEDVPIEVPSDFKGDPDEYVKAERACLAMESWLDDEFGRMVAKVRALGELDNTVILFLGDNGWSTGSWAKGTPMEKGVRSPLVVWRPGNEGAGKKLDALVDLVDVHATVLDYAGAAKSPQARGRSIRPLLEGGAYEPRERLYGACYGRYGNDLPYALYVRDARWKYILFVRDITSKEVSPGARLAPPVHCRTGQQRLYDLAEDPLEKRNLAPDPANAEHVRAMRESVLAWWHQNGGIDLPEDVDGSGR